MAGGLLAGSAVGLAGEAGGRIVVSCASAADDYYGLLGLTKVWDVFDPISV